jgi:hypothetical protein
MRHVAPAGVTHTLRPRPVEVAQLPVLERAAQ